MRYCDVSASNIVNEHTEMKIIMMHSSKFPEHNFEVSRFFVLQVYVNKMSVKWTLTVCQHTNKLDLCARGTGSTSHLKYLHSPHTRQPHKCTSHKLPL